MTRQKTLNDWDVGELHFVGMAGSGMSAIARFLKAKNRGISGSDRQFGVNSQSKIPFEQNHMKCFDQDGSGITSLTFGLCVSTAVETDNPDLKKARELNLPVWHRSEVLSWIAANHRTIAVSGTSGKSTVTAMIFHILRKLQMDPSVISGAALTELGDTGNYYAGSGDWLVLEADESDGSLVNYHPEVGLMLNLDRDHKELSELESLFARFKSQSKHFITWADQERCQPFSANLKWDYGESQKCGFRGESYRQIGWNSSFKFNGEEYTIPFPGRHTMWNALAAISATFHAGINPGAGLKSLGDFKGVYRRHIKLIDSDEVLLVDDFAHNPAKIQAALETCQAVMPKVIAWFQPHGYSPTQFMRGELLERLVKTLRLQDEIWFAPIYYAGGTANKVISAEDLVSDAQKAGLNSRLVTKNELAQELAKLSKNTLAVLLMGARDPSLEDFSHQIKEALKRIFELR